MCCWGYTDVILEEPPPKKKEKKEEKEYKLVSSEVHVQPVVGH